MLVIKFTHEAMHVRSLIRFSRSAMDPRQLFSKVKQKRRRRRYRPASIAGSGAHGVIWTVDDVSKAPDQIEHTSENGRSSVEDLATSPL